MKLVDSHSLNNMTDTTADKDVSRISKILAAQWRKPLTPEIYEYILKFRANYLEIEQDNPNLMWLYTVLLLNRERYYGGQIVAAMKKRLLEAEVLTPVAWRYIANGTASDFRIIIDYKEYGIPTSSNWQFLIYWLQFMSGMKRKKPIPEPIQRLFINDSMIFMIENDEIHFRGAWVKLDTMRHIIQEAENRLLEGSLDQFVESELIDVLTWLAAVDPVLDHNQTKKGWEYLFKTAAKWKVDLEEKETCQKLRWHSVLPQMLIQGRLVVPIVDAWALRRLALSQRHCGDCFIDDCQNGTVRIFVIRNIKGNICAMIRLIPVDGIWVDREIKGFANSEPLPEIIKLGAEIALLYTKHVRLDNSGHKQPLQELTNNDEEIINGDQYSEWCKEHSQLTWHWER